MKKIEEIQVIPTFSEIDKNAFSYLEEGLDINDYELEPLRDRLLLKEIKVVEKRGVIIMVEKDETKEYYFGEVLEAGEGKTLDNGTHIPNQCKKGDIVTFNPRQSFPVKWKGNNYCIIRDAEAITRLKRKV